MVIKGKWDSEDISFLKNNFLEFTNIELAEKLNRTTMSISGKIYRMGLKRPKEWNIERMRNNNPMKNRNIAKKSRETFEKNNPDWRNFNVGQKRPHLSKMNKENIRRGEDHHCWQKDAFFIECKYCKKIKRVTKGITRKPKFCNARCHGDYLIKFGHPDHVMKKIKENRMSQKFPFKDSSIEIKIQNFLKILSIEFFTHQYMKIEHGYQCDILIPIQDGINKKTIIECDGDYWHGNREKFKEEKLTERIIKQRGLDKNRTKELIEKGFRVIRIWGSEIKNMELSNFKKKFLILEKQNVYKV